MLRYLVLGFLLVAAASADSSATDDEQTGVYLDDILGAIVDAVPEVEEVGSEIEVSHSLPNSRIVGGTNAEITDYPWQLSLRRNDNHFCGAALISSNWALSAAHCTPEPIDISRLSLLAGSSVRTTGGTVRPVTRVMNHPEYDTRTMNNDFNLVQVAGAFIFSDAIRPAVLPNLDEDFAAGTYTWVTGWGALESGTTEYPLHLQQISVPIVDQDICNAAYGGAITAQMICAGYMAGGLDACQGDSGGPQVTAEGKLVGIMSWGAGCGLPNFPGVYARVSEYRDWIRENSGV